MAMVAERSPEVSNALRDEISMADARVGQTLVSETNLVRVWHITLAPGERLGFHKHELDYCWIAITAGQSRSMFADGTIVETRYQPGDCKVFSFGKDETMIHDLSNTGDTTLAFTTIEFKGSIARRDQ
ncbi:hypothetical protein [Ensifer canadensis]